MAMEMSFDIDVVQKLKRTSVPLVYVRTIDSPDTVRKAIQHAKAAGYSNIIKWDCVSGISIVCGRDAVRWACDNWYEGRSEIPQDDGSMGVATQDVVSALKDLSDCPDNTAIIMSGMHRQLQDPMIISLVTQGILNLRDPFAATGRQLIMIGYSVFLPPELTQSVVVTEVKPPDKEERIQILAGLADRSGVVDNEVEAKADALTGLSSFACEQIAALSISQAGYDNSMLWSKAKETLNAMKGLSVLETNNGFADIGGCNNIKTFVSRILNGNAKPGVILFLDEIEKMLAGSSGDSSGVSQRLLGLMLSWMEDKQIAGMIFIGPPGAAKSLVAKATASEARVPGVEFHLSKMLGQYVGMSEEALTQAIDVVNAVSDGRVLCMATCNKITTLPPELRRRFKLGTFFFDLPSAEERKAIWEIHRRAFDIIGADEQPEDEGWTGAEIRNCCEIAWRLECTLKEAATYIVPVYVSARADIEALRDSASGRYISASYPGVYLNHKKPSTPTTEPAGRSVITELFE